MAWAYTDTNKTDTIAVPSLSGLNYFSGVQVFSNTTNATATNAAAVTIAGGLAIQGALRGGEVYGAVWNDLADCITVPDETVLEYGYAYCFDGKNYYKSSKYLDDGFIGIHSDTAGFIMGHKPEFKQLQAAVAGFVLAYVDQEYTPGTPLTITKDGKLAAISSEDLSDNYHKIVATFWKKEPAKKWGPEGKEIPVNGRMWVKVK